MISEFQSSKGRGLKVGNKISAGQIVLTDQPMAVVSQTHCTSCFSNGALRKCGACKTIGYCSRKCQQLDWSDHRNECKAIQKTPNCKPTRTVLLAFRIISGKHNCERLVDHFPDAFSPKQVAEYQEIAMLILTMLRCSDQQKSLPSIDQVVRLLAKIKFNAFTIYNNELGSVGIGLYPAAAPINHSCQPNCVAMYSGKTLTIRCVVPKGLEPGTEITISYIDTFTLPSDRREQLMKDYAFKCQCERCADEKRWEEETKRMTGVKKKPTAQVKAVLDQTDPLSIDQLRQIVQIQSDLYTEENIQRLQRSQELYTKLLDLQRFEEAYPHLLAVATGYERLTSTCTMEPMVGIYDLTLGKLCTHLLRDQEAAKYLSRAVSRLTITHGESNQLTQEARHLLQHLSHPDIEYE